MGTFVLNKTENLKYKNDFKTNFQDNQRVIVVLKEKKVGEIKIHTEYLVITNIST